MVRVLSVTEETFPIEGTFTISRGSKTTADVLMCTIGQDEFVGRGECVPYRRYGETVDSVKTQMETARSLIENGFGRNELLHALPAGAARNALDCALWDLEAKAGGWAAATKLCAVPPAPLTTAFTLSLDSSDKMAAQAKANAHRPLLKVKLGGEGDIERIAAISSAAPNSKLIVDANEGWTEANLEQNLEAAARYGVALIEQPLPVGHDSALRHVSHSVPICADESVHVADNLENLVGLYDAVNIKLDKAGGLTAGIELRDQARKAGFLIMVGCMVGTSLAMAPATLLAQGAEFVDLDGPLLLARDRSPALRYEGSMVWPPETRLWG